MKRCRFPLLLIAVLIALSWSVFGCSSSDDEEQADDDDDDGCGSYDFIFNLNFYFPAQKLDGGIRGNISDDTVQGRMSIDDRSADCAGAAQEGGITCIATYNGLQGGIDCNSAQVTVLLDIGLAYDQVIGWAEVYCSNTTDPSSLLDSYDVSGSVDCLDTDFFDG